MTEDEKYYNDKETYSNSLGSLVNPSEGGSPTKLISAINATKQKKTKAFSIGSLVDLAVTEPDKLVFLKTDKPSGKLGELVDKMIELTQETIKRYSPVETFIEKIGKKEETFSANDFYISAKELGVLLLARDEISYDSRLKISTLISSHYIEREAREHFQERIRNKDKVCATAIEKEIVENAVRALKGNSISNFYYYEADTIESIKTFSQLVIKFDYKLDIITANKWFKEYFQEDVIIPCKAKLDKVLLKLSEKIVIIPDLKTTGQPVHLFGGYYDRGRPRQGSFQSFRYYRQGYFYKLAIKKWLIEQEYASSLKDVEENWIIKFEDVVVEVKPPVPDVINDVNYNVGVFALNPAWEQVGRLETLDLIQRFWYCISTGDFTSPFELNNGYFNVINP